MGELSDLPHFGQSSKQAKVNRLDEYLVRQTSDTVIGEYLDEEELDGALDQDGPPDGASPPPVKAFTYMQLVKPSNKRTEASTSTADAAVGTHLAKRAKSNHVVIEEASSLDEVIRRAQSKSRVTA